MWGLRKGDVRSEASQIKVSFIDAERSENIFFGRPLNIHLVLQTIIYFMKIHSQNIFF